MKLDRSRSFATLFDGERQIQCYYQDKRMFDKGTGEELDLDSIAKKAKEPPALVCKFCRAKRQTPELMQEHLVARHSEDMVEADAKARAATEAKEEADAKVEAQANANAEAGAKEKEDAEKLFFTNYGLGTNRKRGLITKAELKWQSLHIALRDLGLDESVKVDGNLIYTAMHIPKDILSLEAKKTTYNNFKESMVSYIQNEQQPSVDAFSAVFQELLKDKNLKLVGSYEHLPIMQFILLERYEGLTLKGEALSAL